MTKPLIIANWKMNLLPDEAKTLAGVFKKKISVSLARDLDIILCPSFDSLYPVAEVLDDSAIALGAQDVFWQQHGAFTGEISAQSLQQLGCRYTIIGHSERRKYLNEDNEMINRKVHAALDAGLIPIVCVGEAIEERREQHQDLAVMTQVMEGLNGLTLKPEAQLIVAYEPVWVIGTGQAIEPAEAERMSKVIRQALIDVLPLEQVRDQCRIIYGGSVNADNIKEFLDFKLIDGVLVGNASLNEEEFYSLIKAAQ
jgi:triosephosphate isomerase